MIKVVATNAVVSKRYDNSPALKFGEKGGSVRFRNSKKLYDQKVKDIARWMNISVMTFEPICERIKKMKFIRGHQERSLGEAGAVLPQKIPLSYSK